LGGRSSRLSEIGRWPWAKDERFLGVGSEPYAHREDTAMTRREKFRAYMASVDPAASPLTAIERGFYVDPPGAISSQIIGRFEIEPTARQLVVGAIGSGKSTQLLVARDRANESPDLAASYIDVGEKQDLARARPGCLVALASLVLMEHIEGVEQSRRQRIKGWAHGYEYDPQEPDPEAYDSGYEYAPGILSPPPRRWPSIAEAYIDDLKSLVSSMAAKKKQPVCLFDSLDRINDQKVFSSLVEEDVAALHECGVGVVLVGPPRQLAGFGRIDADLFDHLHVQPPIDVVNDSAGRNFLASVLRRRAPSAERNGLGAEEPQRLDGDDAFHKRVGETTPKLVLILQTERADWMSALRTAVDEAGEVGARAWEVIHAQIRGRIPLVSTGVQPTVSPKEVHERARMFQSFRDAQNARGTLSDDALKILVRKSGGVLRDLISLAKLAGEEAYLAGKDQIDASSAEVVADRFGRSLLIGLDPRELDALKQVHATGRFVPVTTSDSALLATRRVLEYRTRPAAFAVHPCVEPLLADAGGIG
jgi:hypothetical protein